MLSEMPEGWKACLLDEAVRIDWGDTSITKKSYVDRGYLAYSAAGGDGYLPYFDYEATGVIVSAIGNCGRVFLADGKWTAIKNTMVVFPKRDKSDIKFFYYMAQQPQFWDINGGVQPFIGLKKAKQQRLILPPLPEQKRIAEILGSVDASIEATRAVIGQAERVKRGLMEELLTGGLGSEAIGRGEAPKGWATSAIGEVASINDENLSAKTPPSYKFRYISIEDVETNKILGSSEMSFSDAPSRARRRVRRGDIILSTVRPYLKAFAQIQSDEEDLVVSTGFAVLRGIDSVCGDYLYQLIFSDSFIKYLTGVMTGSNYPAVKPRDIASYKFLLPPFPKQKRIAEILSSIDDFIASQKAIIEQQTRAKKGLMDDLLTGRVRTV